MYRANRRYDSSRLARSGHRPALSAWHAPTPHSVVLSASHAGTTPRSNPEREKFDSCALLCFSTAHCLTITVGTSNGIPLNGTLFAAVNTSPTVARISALRVQRLGSHALVLWSGVNTAGIAGFNVYAGHLRVNARPIPVHAARTYRFDATWHAGRYALHLVLSNGGQFVVPAR